MNFPTNKLRDIIATLQTLDPDLEVNLEAVDIVHNPRRTLQITTVAATKYAKQLSDLGRDLDKHHVTLADLAASANNLVTQLGSLQVQLAQNSDDIDRTLNKD